MLLIPEDDIIQNTATFSEAYKKASESFFTEEDFLRKVVPRLSEKCKNKYPYQVKIPKSNFEMLQGDFEPSKIVTIEEPIQGAYGEMWFGNTMDGVVLFGGYKNGDSRYECKKALGDADVHGILAGATGQGKSVTLNALIYGGCYVYPPWELKLTLCDAKIIEFKSIAINTPMPQISSVAATGDADYLISVLEDAYTEMTERNMYFTKASEVFGKKVDKIENFRKVTGLSLPQMLLVIDEFQSMFKNAGKKLGKLMDILYKIIKLGRNTGVHLLLASQEIGSDLSKEMMSNIKIRMAMGCFPNVSEAILGNDGAAANMGKKGYMIMNTNSSQPNSKLFNETYRVPFITPDNINDIAQCTIEKGKLLGVANILKFFDEQALLYDSKFDNFLSSFKKSPDRIILGEPAFVLNEEEQCVTITFSNEDIEHVVVDTGAQENTERFIKTFMRNIQYTGGSSSVVLCTNPTIDRNSGLSKFAGNLYYESKQYENNPFFSIARDTVYKRKIMLQADKNIFSGQNVRNEETDKYFDDVMGKGSEFDSELNRERCAQYLYITATDATARLGLGMTNISKDKEKEIRQGVVEDYLLTCKDYDVLSIQLTADKLPLLYFWIVGLERIIGLGRTPKSKYLDELLRVMQDADVVRCRFLVFTTTFNDMTVLLGGFRWFILDGITMQEVTRVKAGDDYPNEVSGGLAVLRDKSITDGNSCKKFKKLINDGEIVL